MILQNILRDFKTHNHDIRSWGFWAMVVYRFGRWRYRIPWRWVRLPFSLAYKQAFFFIKAVGIELPCEVDVGKNFRIDHQGGIVIHGQTRIGDHCVLRHNVTIGMARTDHPHAAPVIGNNVDIGAGAGIFGNIVIGNNVTIGANAVVTKNVPDDSLAVGVPAVIKRKPYKRKSDKQKKSRTDLPHTL